ncbi:hypothetical protein Skr01_56140 [Sphaerisporangium krabiense]|nr:hypothetical protein Skr01_56140 [Sphaerisporangium krabiense]
MPGPRRSGSSALPRPPSEFWWTRRAPSARERDPSRSGAANRERSIRRASRSRCLSAEASASGVTVFMPATIRVPTDNSGPADLGRGFHSRDLRNLAATGAATWPPAPPLRTRTANAREPR